MKSQKIYTAKALILAAGIVAAMASPAISSVQTPPADGSRVTTPDSKGTSTPSGESHSSTAGVQDGVDSATMEIATRVRDRAVEGAVSALSETNKAIRALDANDPEAAIDSIEKAIGKLHTVHALNPELDFVPIGASVSTVDFVADKDQIKDQIKEVQRLIRHNQIQDARKAIGLLASETVISESEIPLVAFPDALIEAARMIREEKLDQAKALIARTLDTVVIVDHVIPLPLIRAEQLLQRASILAENGDRTDAQSRILKAHLADAQEQIKIAEMLGYGTKKDFKHFYDQLDLIKLQSKNSKPTKGLFKKINTDLKNMRRKIFK